jgi:glycosyltransferase involved in cell wall biosynthesis
MRKDCTLGVRSALVTVVAALPASELKNSLLRRLGWAIGDGVQSVHAWSSRSTTSTLAAEHGSVRRIVILVRGYFPVLGGTSTQTRLLAKGFQELGLSVIVLTNRTAGAPKCECRDGVEVRRVGVAGWGRIAKLALMLSAWVWLLRRRSSIWGVNAVMDVHLAIVSRLAGLGRKTILTWATRGDPAHFLSGLFGALRLPLLRGCRHVALTPKLRDELEEMGIHGAVVIPVPVDLQRFSAPDESLRAEARNTLGIRPEQTVLVYVGNLVRRKGVANLIRAFDSIDRVDEQGLLLIVGGPVQDEQSYRYMQEILDLAEASPHAQTIRFCGAQDDVVPYLRAADIFCLPSYREGMPNAIVEAMACGLACVAPPSAGGDELLEGGCGLIPASNTPGDLALSLSEIMANGSLRTKLGSEAAMRVTERNSVAPVARDYLALWRLFDVNRAVGLKSGLRPAVYG